MGKHNKKKYTNRMLVGDGSLSFGMTNDDTESSEHENFNIDNFIELIELEEMKMRNSVDNNNAVISEHVDKTIIDDHNIPVIHDINEDTDKVDNNINSPKYRQIIFETTGEPYKYLIVHDHVTVPMTVCYGNNNVAPYDDDISYHSIRTVNSLFLNYILSTVFPSAVVTKTELETAGINTEDYNYSENFVLIPSKDYFRDYVLIYNIDVQSYNRAMLEIFNSTNDPNEYFRLLLSLVAAIDNQYPSRFHIINNDVVDKLYSDDANISIIDNILNDIKITESESSYRGIGVDMESDATGVFIQYMDYSDMFDLLNGYVTGYSTETVSDDMFEDDDDDECDDSDDEDDECDDSDCDDYDDEDENCGSEVTTLYGASSDSDINYSSNKSDDDLKSLAPDDLEDVTPSSDGDEVVIPVHHK